MTPLRVSIASAAIAFAVYATTAARTITWWDGSSYPLAAVKLGVPGAPGSLLLTLLGWLATRVRLVHPVAFQLNLIAGLIAACTVGLVTRLAITLATPEGRAMGPREALGGALAGLTLALGPSLWTYATRFTPYGLSALFTALILTVALAWWRRAETSDATPWLFVLALLFGLDVSVHRTNLLLLPAALVWVTLGRPSAWRRAPAWGAAFAGLTLGLAFHLLLIPVARRDPLFNIDDPSSLARFWGYVSLDRSGGGFLIHLLPRTAHFVKVQLADYATVMGSNLWPRYPSPAGAVPLALVLVGAIAAVRAAPRRTIGILGFYACASLGAVIYFNLPAHYFRTMDRHYLPSLVILAPLIGAGAAALMRAMAGARGGLRNTLALGLGGLLLFIPVMEWAANRAACDLSRVRFAETYSRDVLETLPKDAILLTNGDNDSFPLWYLQQVEGVRGDVSVINLPMSNSGMYLAQLRRHDPRLAGLLAGEPGLGILGPWHPSDSLVTIPVGAEGATSLPDSIPPPASITIRLGGDLYGEDQVVLDLIRLNRWRRPLMLAVTVSPELLTWIRPYMRYEGLNLRVIPSTDPAVMNLDRLRTVLMHQVQYAGVADSTIRMDSDTKALCSNYAAALFNLAYIQLNRGDARGCLDTLALLEQRLPAQRLGPQIAESVTPLRKHAEAVLEATRD